MLCTDDYIPSWLSPFALQKQKSQGLVDLERDFWVLWMKLYSLT